MPLKIVVGNITDVKCDAIVNFYLGRFGQDSSISKELHRLGGDRLLEECKSSRVCFVGESVITNAFGVNAKYIIHTVAPTNLENLEHNLARCYKSAFSLGVTKELCSIAYPLITSDVFSISTEKAAQIALNRIVANLKHLDAQIFVCLVVPDIETLDVVLRIANDIVPESYYTIETPPLLQHCESSKNADKNIQSVLLDNYNMLRGALTPKQIGEDLFRRWLSYMKALYIEAVQLKNAEWSNQAELNTIAINSNVWNIFRVVTHDLIGSVNGYVLETPKELACLLVAYVTANKGMTEAAEERFRRKLEYYLARQIIIQNSKSQRLLKDEKTDKNSIRGLRKKKAYAKEHMPNKVIVPDKPVEPTMKERILWEKDSVLYIYKGSIRCHRSSHNIIQATALFYGKADEEIRLNVEYCSECKKFFLNYVAYEEYRNRYGAIIGNLRMATNGSFDGQSFVAQESPLMLSGYNVNQRDGFTSNERHYILARFMHDGIMSKGDIIKYLTHFIQKNGKKKGNEIAVSKWRNDLDFVQSYNIHTQPRTIISDVRRY